MKLIPLTKGRFAMVDNVDFDRVNKFKWHLRVDEHSEYAQTHIRRNGKRTTTSLHRVVMRARRGKGVDHKDGNGLNCRKKNLRICSQKKNCHNRKVHRTNKSGFKGVCFHKAAGKWNAQISVPKLPRRIGFFPTALDAAKAYDAAAIKHFGAFAKTNKSMGLYVS